MADDLNFLQEKAREWAGKVVNLYNTPVPPSLEAEKKALLVTAKKIKDGVESITGPLTYLNAMNSMNLGFIPIVVGVVGVAGAAALITKWTLDYQTFTKKIEDRNKLIAGGLTPQQAAQVVNQAEKQTGSLFNIDVGKVFLGIGGIAALYWWGRKNGWF